MGDDVRIGSHVVVPDGVTIGDHCVIGAGAVVTKDLPAWTMAAGNPARRIRDRRESGGRKRPTTPGDVVGRGDVGRSSDGRGDDGVGEALARFAETARGQAADILARCWNGDRYTDRPGAAPTVRAHCDAVEIADLLLSSAPGQLDRTEHIDRLEELPWRDNAWGAGAWIDSWATAAHGNLRHPTTAGLAPGAMEALFGSGPPPGGERRLPAHPGILRAVRDAHTSSGAGRGDRGLQGTEMWLAAATVANP
nr:acyltransferase [Streptomyces sp. ME02-8801-2C]